MFPSKFSAFSYEFKSVWKLYDILASKVAANKKKEIDDNLNSYSPFNAADNGVFKRKLFDKKSKKLTAKEKRALKIKDRMSFNRRRVMWSDEWERREKEFEERERKRNEEREGRKKQREEVEDEFDLDGCLAEMDSARLFVEEAPDEPERVGTDPVPPMKERLVVNPETASQDARRVELEGSSSPVSRRSRPTSVAEAQAQRGRSAERPEGGVLSPQAGPPPPPLDVVPTPPE